MDPSQSTPLTQPVLLIEDQHAVANWARQVLSRHAGCRVDWAATLAQARQLLEQAEQPYFIAVADLLLPDAEADAVLDLLRQHGLQAVAVTADYDPALRATLLKRGLVDYVLKDNSHVYHYVSGLIQRLWRNRQQAVLVVDDAASVRGLVVSWLTRLGLCVHQVADGQEALAWMARDPAIRLVLTDRHMPGMDGFALVKELRRQRGRDRLAIIGFSASEAHDLSARFLKLGANDFLVKPFSYEELCARVHQNLDMLDTLEALRELASRDSLTGLFNRRHFFAEGRALSERPAPAGQMHLVVMLDVDHFKQVNDRHGHAAGDAVLRQLGALLTARFADGLCARLGGEEFALLLTGAPSTLLERLEALRLEFAALSQGAGGEPFQCSFSGGVVGSQSAPLEDLLRQADQRLYEAKQAGRNRILGSGVG
ncbi:diguanylate cyclase (GGDEF)-like protein [Inhella inkyongensis]|uniref:diguanylate cyclase n=1 Tax=Inhella inkyongensis TaxID=392593 RepID=A0A840RXZ2_9BURK|nr:response regulator [Inhella inkyongensis]MBB5203577.1 diguanylate cyclase (GGDEF)-like protein [Inhella inkyongensis]